MYAREREVESKLSSVRLLPLFGLALAPGASPSFRRGLPRRQQQALFSLLHCLGVVVYTNVHMSRPLT